MPSPNDQNVSQVSHASRILRARGSPSTPKALNLRQISDLVQNDGDIPTSARDLIRDLIDFAEDRDTNAILARRELRKKDVLLNTRKRRKTGKRVALRTNTSLQKRISLRWFKILKKELKIKRRKKEGKRRNTY
jgi:hypothetical protein